jgi:hypothetical protein
MSSPTTNYGFPKPTVGGDVGNWGTELNTALDDIDTQLKAVSDVAAGAMQTSGGASNDGTVTATALVAAAVNLGSAINGTMTLDLSQGQMFYGSMSGNVTSVVFSNVPSGAVFFALEITNPTGYTITWPSKVKWPSGSAPALTNGGTDVLICYSLDGGNTIHAGLAMKDTR